MTNIYAIKNRLRVFLKFTSVTERVPMFGLSIPPNFQREYQEFSKEIELLEINLHRSK